MQTRFELLNILADGNFYSGDELGLRLGIGRSAIWRHIRTLRSYGLNIYAVTGRGYRLSKAVERLSESQITAALSDVARTQGVSLELHQVLDSTNSYLMRPPALTMPTGTTCFAEFQTAGRGRQGRRWVAAYGSSLCFSLLWRYDCGPDALSGLSLAVSVGLAQGLASMGLQRPGLKWPNDLYVDGRKLAGILLEMSGEAGGVSRVVIGVGLNFSLSPAEAGELEQPWVSLLDLLPEPVDRNRAAGVILSSLVEALMLFESEGLAPFLPQWQRWDVTYGKQVTLQQSQRVIEGRAKGVDASGALLIECKGEICRYMSGDVSLLRAV